MIRKLICIVMVVRYVSLAHGVQAAQTKSQTATSYTQETAMSARKEEHLFMQFNVGAASSEQLDDDIEALRKNQILVVKREKDYPAMVILKTEIDSLQDQVKPTMKEVEERMKQVEDLITAKETSIDKINVLNEQARKLFIDFMKNYLLFKKVPYKFVKLQKITKSINVLDSDVVNGKNFAKLFHYSRDSNKEPIFNLYLSKLVESDQPSGRSTVRRQNQNQQQPTRSGGLHASDSHDTSLITPQKGFVGLLMVFSLFMGYLLGRHQTKVSGQGDALKSAKSKRKK